MLDITKNRRGCVCFTFYLFFAGELIFALGYRQSFNHLFYIAHHKGIDGKERKSYSVVGNSALREVIGSDTLAPVPASDKALSMLVIGGAILRAVKVV